MEYSGMCPHAIDHSADRCLISIIIGKQGLKT